MHIAIVGAGAVGSWLATSLSRQGDDVTMILRPEAVSETGALRLTVTTGTREAWAIVPTSTDIPDACDLVILAVPMDVCEQLLPELAQRAVPLLCLQSAPELPEVMGRVAPQSPIASVVPSGLYAREGRGQAHVIHDEPLYYDASLSASLRDHLARFCQMEYVPDLAAIRWSRALAEIALVPVALTNAEDASIVLEDRKIQGSIATVLREATRVMATARLSFVSIPGSAASEISRLHSTPAIFAGRTLQHYREHLYNEPSPLLQHLRRGQWSEIEWSLGAFVRAGERQQIPTPQLTALRSLVDRVMTRGQFMTRAELAKAL